jgi:C6 transcription factor Pro1
MDGGEKEKDAAAETRRLIKNAARREPAPASRDPSFSNAPSSGQSPTQDPGSPLEKDLANIVLHGAPQGSVTSSGGVQGEQGVWKSKPESRSNSAVPLATWTQNEHFNGFEGAFNSASPRPVDYSLPQALKGREASLLM